MTSALLFFFFPAEAIIFTASLSAMDHIMHPHPLMYRCQMKDKQVVAQLAVELSSPPRQKTTQITVNAQRSLELSTHVARQLFFCNSSSSD